VTINAGTPNSSGQFAATFATAGVTASAIGFRAHYIDGRAPYKNSLSACADQKIVARSVQSAWSMFHHDLAHMGLSPFDTSADTGSQKWQFTTGSAVQSSPAIGNDGTIYVGSEDDNLYAINSDGSEKWKFTTSDPADSSPAIGSDGTIYVGSGNDNLYAIH